MILVNNITTIKNYDGTNIVSITLSGFIYGDYITISGSTLLSDINTGLTTLTISGFIVDSNNLQNNNYILESNIYNFTILPIEIIPIFNIDVCFCFIFITLFLYL